MAEETTIKPTIVQSANYSWLQISKSLQMMYWSAEEKLMYGKKFTTQSVYQGHQNNFVPVVVSKKIYFKTDFSGIICCCGFSVSHFQRFFVKYQLILPVKSS